MKILVTVKSLVAGATMMAGAAVASTPVATPAAVPAPAASAIVAEFVDRYAARRQAPATRDSSTDTAVGHATALTVYSTADSDAVFVTFRMADVSHIALVETQYGRVKRFTDFTGRRVPSASVRKAPAGDAQAQAGSLLLPALSFAGMSSSGASDPHWTGAQLQAAQVMQSATVWTLSPQVVGRPVPRLAGEGLQARAVIASSIGQR
jgi:hypothetical protein